MNAKVAHVPLERQACMVPGCFGKGRLPEIPACEDHWLELDPKVHEVIWAHYWPNKPMDRDVSAYVRRELSKL